MLKNRRPAWLTIGTIILTLLLNVIIIEIAFYVDDWHVFWMLIVSIPLLTIAIYNAWQTKHLLQKHLAGDMQPSTLQCDVELLSHSVYPNKIAPTDLKVQIGNDQCSQPYSACIFNVDFIEDKCMKNTLTHITKEGEFEYSEYSVDEGLNTYHLATGGFVWQIGPNYLGCRTENGHFNREAFKTTAHRPEVKMIELKLSSAIKRVYPVDSFLGFAAPIERKIEDGIFSGSAYTTFSNAEGMIHFLNNLRELSGGKPVGIRLCISDKKEFYQICYAIQKTQLIPDFMVVEGSFERRDIIHSDQAFHIGIPLYDALLFVSQTLPMYGLQNKIKVIADGKIISCFDILKVLALGADIVCTKMPYYPITKYAGDDQKSSLHYKNQNVYSFHNNLLKDTIQIMKICGFKSVSDITLPKFFGRLDVLHSKNFDELNGPVLYPGSVKKIYKSKVKSHRPQDEMKQVSIL